MATPRELLARFSERNFLFYAFGAYFRERLRGRDPLPILPEFEGKSEYLKDYAKWQALRSRLLRKDELRMKRLFRANSEPVVAKGPFAGTRFAGCEEEFYVSMMLGYYEPELHPFIEAAVSRGYSNVINIGCAAGYYAVGLARRLPSATIHAFDINERARSACQRLARQNGVEDRVRIQGQFHGPEFEELATEDTLVLCDIEGGEYDVLDPTKHPALLKADAIVELHGFLVANVAEAVTARFETSHTITRVREGDHPMPDLPPWLMALGGVERFVACHTSGQRWGGMPWAVMIAGHDVDEREP